MEVDAIEATKCSTNLILGTNCLLKQILLYMYCIGGKCMLITHLVLERIQTKEKPHGERRTCAQAGSSRQVSHVMDFNSTIHSEKLKAPSHRWMLDCTVGIHVFNF